MHGIATNPLLTAMMFGVELPIEIVCALISLAGVIASGVISWGIAQDAASKELGKMKATWEREDTVTSDDEFGEMVRLVILYSSGISVGPYEAMAAIGALRAKELGEVATVLDSLYQAVKRRDVGEIEKQLDNAIDARRTQKENRKKKSK